MGQTRKIVESIALITEAVCLVLIGRFFTKLILKRFLLRKSERVTLGDFN